MKSMNPADLDPVDILFYYDGPILFTARIEGETRLVFLTDMNQGADRKGSEFHVASPSPELLREVRSNWRPLRDSHVQAPFFRILWTTEAGPQIEEIAAIDERFLPDEGVLLHDEPLPEEPKP
ncbi:hypothetical protein LAZ40_02215 [Cereibacter sphaeroides]|uniref:hypothetical protein n=1 Tax=Cereibacter sphaeroides TaxID=1063 RepID=UPI001F485F7A|nr:hypothetical protein [Cereibacter sphaeroides]MCE6957872.1 hypothetical protein [Cereibacter sphaeroides]MCE6971841.1 hypothetical protein [Cereibacter sphaeroides]